MTTFTVDLTQLIVLETLIFHLAFEITTLTSPETPDVLRMYVQQRFVKIGVAWHHFRMVWVTLSLTMTECILRFYDKCLKLFREVSGSVSECIDEKICNYKSCDQLPQPCEANCQVSGSFCGFCEDGQQCQEIESITGFISPILHLIFRLRHVLGAASLCIAKWKLCTWARRSSMQEFWKMQHKLRL